MYTVQLYGRMIMDRLRTEAYLAAMRKAIRPGSVVVDIGTGTGYFAMAACRLGAARVYAIEPADAIAVAQQIAAENGLSDKIRFFQEMSTRLTLPEPADVIVSDIRGRLPLFGMHIPSIIDARSRLLKPGGVLIPQQDRLWTALVEAPKIYAEQVDMWRSMDPEIRMEAARRISSNDQHNGGEFLPEQLLSDSHCWATLDYRTITEAAVRGEISFAAGRSGTAHGFGMWFETTLYEDIGFSIGPSGSGTIYGRAFFPFQEPIAVAQGDVVSVALRADLVGEDYIWTWNTTLPGKACFRQSTFMATAFNPQALRRTASDYVPTLGGEGEIERFVLNQMNGVSTLQQIATRLCVEFPQRFRNSYQALTKVARLSKSFSRPERAE